VITTNLLFRTLFISAIEYGTAFAIEVDGVQYLVTARHLLDTSAKSLELKYYYNDTWQAVSVDVVGHGHGEIDISVLRARAKITAAEYDVVLSMAGTTLGQDVYFLGFPYKMWGEVGPLMGGFPMPFAKKGTISSFQLGALQVLHIDAINNEGFSGGPIFFTPPGRHASPQVIGVVSKFRIEHEHIIDGDGRTTDMYVPYNTGFLVGYGIRHALDIINASATV
jgi:S1-C subfamily serine protease